MIITISGRPGSGKSVVAKTLAKKLKVPHYSTGDFMRGLAQRRGRSLMELTEQARRDGGRIDRLLDNYQRQLGKEKKQFVIDARLGFYFIPQSIKIFLEVEQDVAAERVFRQHRDGVERLCTLAQAKKELKKRTDAERERYRRYYGVDYIQKRNYDFVVDTTQLTIAQVVGKIMRFLKKKRSK